MRAGYRAVRRLGTILAAVTLTASACSAPVTQHKSAAPLPPLTPAPAATSARPAVSPASVHADELGVVPVLMYHQLVAVPKGDYDQTPAQFRTELDALYAHHFRPITAAALVSRQFDLPAGTSPMVLSFDDSTTSQYAELPDGTVKPDCAVGILLAVAKRYGDDHPVASFYVNARPFGGKDTYLAKLTALGMELGDHTATHANLRQLDGAGVQRELAKGLAVITGAVPAAKVTTMALPFGVQPHDRALAHASTAAGTSYDFAAVLLVGANPARSPYGAAIRQRRRPRAHQLPQGPEREARPQPEGQRAALLTTQRPSPCHHRQQVPRAARAALRPPLPDDHRGRAGGRPGRPAGRDQPDGAHLRRLDLVAVRRAAAAAGARAAARVVLFAAFAQTCLPRCRYRGVRYWRAEDAPATLRAEGSRPWAAWW